MIALGLAAVMAFAAATACAQGGGPQKMAFQIETDALRYAVAADGHNAHFIDKAAKTDYCAQPGTPFALIHKAGKEYASTSVVATGGKVTVGFGDSGVSAVLRVTAAQRYLTVEVVSVSDQQIEEFVFLNVQLTLKGVSTEPFTGCALALNLKTNVEPYPGPMSQLRAMCYPKFGLAGAKVAVIGCPQRLLRKVIQDAVSVAPDLPHSPVGGPWAMDADICNGSYLFNFGDMSEDKVDSWIKVAKSIGFNQIDFHGGSSFRFGDFRPNPVTYPKGYASLKAVIDKLHAAGIKAGLHTYAFFIDKHCPYVTPVPDPRLAKSATFTLAQDLPADATTVPVVESTKDESALTGFFVQNSATIQVDDELIVFSGVSKQPPYAYTGCTRGACGTKVAAHKQGAKVQHLKECFGLFVPDPETTMLDEIAANTARIYNECGFDMMYLDALDGEAVLGGWQNAWHYGSEFVFDIYKRVNKPPLMEMSTFHHHLWYVRSRLGAWDVPMRSHKRFIDLHVAGNEDCRRIFMPANLGWWALFTWSGAQGEPTFSDDIEYLCCKAIGYDYSLSLMGINPDNYDKPGAMKELAPIFQRYETLRHARYFPESVKAKLRQPGAEFTLVQDSRKQWQLQPVEYTKHRVEGVGEKGDTWETSNSFDAQPLQLRLQALLSAGPYEAPGNVTLAGFTATDALPDQAAAGGVTAKLEMGAAAPPTAAGETPAPRAPGFAKLTATSALAARAGSWAKFGKTFSPPLNLSAQQAMGVWVYGDGKGEVLNVQLKSPENLTGMADHYIIVDFTGWRYFEMIEPEGERHALYGWPYGDAYSIYREPVNYGSVESFSLWVNNLPPKGDATVYISPVRAMPLADSKLINPSVSIGGKTVTFPVEIPTGSYLEFRSMTDCKLYGPQGAVAASVEPKGDVPALPAGKGQATFNCTTPAGLSGRAYLTLSARGQALPNK
jgi:hypothetical protein